MVDSEYERINLHPLLSGLKAELLLVAKLVHLCVVFEGLHLKPEVK